MNRWGWVLAALLAGCAPDRTATYCTNANAEGPGSRYPRCFSIDECGGVGGGVECYGTGLGRGGRCVPACRSDEDCALRLYCTSVRGMPGFCLTRCGSDAGDSVADCPADQLCSGGFCYPITCAPP